MTNNPGKLRKGPKLFIGEKTISSDPIYRQFFEPEFGYRAMFIQIREYAQLGLDTIEKLITRWATSTKEETETYIKFVSINTAYPEDLLINTSDKVQMIRLVSAISHYENHQIPDEKTILKAWEMIDVSNFL